MEDNENQKSIYETPPTFTSPPVPVVPKPKKSLLKKIIFIIVVLFIIGVVLVSGAAVYFFFSISTSCTKKSHAITSTDNQLRTRLNDLRIDGRAGSTVSSDANTDCVDGSDVVNVSADYKIDSPNVIAANAKVFKDLHGSNTAKQQPYTPNNLGDNSKITDLETFIKATDGSTYAVSYNLKSPITCLDNGQITGCILSTALVKYDLINQPISSVTLGLSGVAKY